MAKYSASFKEWLSGDFPYSEPPAWTYSITSTGVTIKPARKLIVYLWVFFLFISAFVVPLWFAFIDIKEKSLWFFRIVPLFFGIIVVFLACLIVFGLAKSLIHYWKGPYLIYTALEQSIFLPREQLVFHKSSVLEWRVVSGNWSGLEGAQKKEDDPMYELQLIVKDHEDSTAYVIVGSKNDSAIVQATEIAQAMGLPIEKIVQHQGITQKPPQRRSYEWDS